MSFLVDTHCHLNLGHLKEDVSRYVLNASMKGVKYLHTICTKISEFQDILDISGNFPNIYCSVGLHPCNVSPETIVSAEHLTRLSCNPKVISFGETGLDYYHPGFNKKLQQESFISHIEAATKTNLPIIVHTRSASIDTIDILTTEMKNSPFTGVIHCFTEDLSFAQKALDLGMYISLAGIVTFKNATSLQDVARQIPINRLLIETDSPYLAPTPMRSKPNEPSYISYTAGFLANLYNLTYNEFADITTENASRIFRKASFI
ncbi:MAG: YchF/TatD family DNA exonuclease [Alphaproteobacteria bacterium]|nr:YchF/TatD family DNA exonuclease [Alphaproteobacteria bacterium]